MSLTADCQTKIGGTSFTVGLWLTMKLTMVLLMTFSLQLHAKDSKAQNITIVKKHAHLSEVFKNIENQTRYLFFYDRALVQGAGPVDIAIRDATLDQALHTILKGRPLTYSLVGRTVVVRGQPFTRLHSAMSMTSTAIRLVGTPFPPPVEIHGRVVDSKGNPLANVSVLVSGTTVGTTTNSDGRFSITAPDNKNVVLEFSSVGFVAQKVTAGNRTEVNVSLETANTGLDEVVVIGYGTQKRSEVTGASTTVGEKTIQERPITQLDQALQGTVAGVIVTSGSGQPGNGLMVKIRGANSITGSNEPLYVIDGNIGQGSDVDVDDVASIEVLKDAASTAIYGSRGSNGVVLITTKSGRPGKPKVELNSWAKRSEIPKRLDIMSAYDFARSVNAQFAAQGSSAAFTDSELQNFKENGGTDWVGEITRKPWAQNYDLSVTGGSENVNYRFSTGYLSEPGIMVNQYHRRASFRGKVGLKLNKKINIDVNFDARIPDSRNNGYGSGFTEPFNQTAEFDPTSPVRNSDGSFFAKSPYASIQYNPVAQALSQIADRHTTVASGNVTFKYQVFPSLTFTSTDAYNLRARMNRSVFGPGTAQYHDAVGYATTEYSNVSNYLSSNYLTYIRDVNKYHRFVGTLLYEISSGKTEGNLLTSTSLSTYGLGYYNLGLGQTQVISSNYSKDALVSYMGRVNYSFKNKYYLTVSLRSDGSSHLTKKYSWFPAVGAKWTVSNEEFMSNSKTVSNLALRLSYGQTGNQAVPAYATIPLINIRSGQPNYYFDGTKATIATELGAPVSKNLKWEVKSSYDAGVDVSLLQSRLSFTIDAYYNRVKDLLYGFQAPFYIGGGVYSRNIGEIENKGIEFGMTIRPLPPNSAIKWNSNLTLSSNRNKILNLGGLDNVQAGTGRDQVTIMRVGRPLGEFFGMKFLGTWKSHEADEAAKYGMVPGDAKFFDLDNDLAYTANDYVPIGNGTPSFGFGFTNNISYKNFSLDIMFQGTTGGQIFSQTIAYMWGGLGDVKNATYGTAIPENLWTPDHETDNPHWSSTGMNFNRSSRYVYNANYVKLKNIAFNYTVPIPEISKKPISLVVYVSAQNLFTITSYPGYDPETYVDSNPLLTGVELGMIPNPKAYTIGFRLEL